MIHLLRHKSYHMFPTLLLFLFFFFFNGRTTHQQLQPQISPIDLSALRQIRNNLNSLPHGPNFFSSWDFTVPDPCSTFAGVTCSYFTAGAGAETTKRVTSLTLGTDDSGLRLSGNLSPSLSDLTELTQLVLFSGVVNGPIPPQIGNLKNLRILSLTNNRLTGIIPAAVAALPNLHTLDLSTNILSGPLPAFTANQLKVLILSSNRLSGYLPENLPNQILHLDLQNNRFAGYLPGKLPAGIRYLSASRNKLWGPLDNGLLESLSELVYLDLSMNRFSGSIPVSLFRSSLSSLLLQRNNLSGWIPLKPGSNNNPSSWPILSPPSSYGPGSIVDLSHNSLTGSLSNILIGVETLFLNNNRFSGHIPDGYVDSMRTSTTKTLYLQHNYFSGFPSGEDLNLPRSVSLCLSYNCMVPPKAGVAACPASAGEEPSRPTNQCPVFNTILVG